MVSTTKIHGIDDDGIDEASADALPLVSDRAVYYGGY